MLKYQELIDKLNVRQKLSLLSTGRLTPEPSPSSGILSLEARELFKMHKLPHNGIVYPPFNSLCNTFDLQLIYSIVAELANRARNEGINALILPDFSVRNHPFKNGMSEDVTYNAKLLAAYIKAVNSGGVMPIVRIVLDEIDVDYMDLVPDKNVIFEQFNALFKEIDSSHYGVVLCCEGLKKEYSDVAALIEKNLPREAVLGLDANYLSEQRIKDNKAFILNGGTKLLKEAYEKHKRIKEDSSSGIITKDELNAALKADDVLTDVELDEALNRFFDFVYKCKKCSQDVKLEELSQLKPEILAHSAAEESLVLLKNDNNALPLFKNERVVVVGEKKTDASFDPAQSLVNTISANESNNYKPFNFVGLTYYGYDADGSELITQALKKLEKADTAVVFLSTDSGFEKRAKEERSLKLPSNQLALLDAIKSAGKLIIAVLCSDYAVDISFARLCHAVILLPSSGTYTSLALYKTMTGFLSPNGKLSYTLYEKVDERFKEIKDNKDAKKTKIGQFYGYKYYDLEDGFEGYPFGFGLGYGNFKYSFLRIDSKSISFKVKNKGTKFGREIAQIYLGKNETSIVRPKKVLLDFERVTLNSGESTVVTIPLNDKDFECLDANGQSHIERGNYTIRVGSSVFDLRLKGKVFKNGYDFEKSCESTSDYILSKSNILDKGYALSSSSKGIKETVVNNTAIERLFLEEFSENEKEEELAIKTVSEDILDGIDTSITMKSVLVSLTTFLNERGIYPSLDSVKSVLSALLASRIIVLRGDDTQLLEEFVSKVGEFFGDKQVLSTAHNDEDESLSLIKPILDSIEKAQGKKDSVFISLLEGAQNLENADLIEPFIALSQTPHKEVTALFKGKKQITISQNLWFFIVLRDDETLDGVDRTIINSAVVLNLRLKRGDIREERKGTKTIGFKQLLWLLKDCTDKEFLSEMSFKKLDKIEGEIYDDLHFRADNKQLRKCERFSASLLALDTTEHEALDMTVAACLMPSLLKSGIGKTTRAKLLEVVLRSLGSGNDKNTQELIKASILGVK